MTAQEIREKYFIPGSAVILSTRVEVAIGERLPDPIFAGEITPLRCTVLCLTSFEEWLATLKPEYRHISEKIYAEQPEIYAYFYEVSVD